MAKKENLKQKVNSLLEEEKFSEIIELLPDKILKEQNDAELYFSRAWAHRSMGEDEKSEPYRKQSLEIDLTFQDRILEKGNDWFNKGDFHKAINEYEKCIFLNPLYYIAFYNKALALQRLDKTDKAILSFTKSISIENEYANSYLNRGKAYYNKKEYDKAIADFSKVLKLDPKSNESCLYRGLSWHYKEDYKKAIEDYSKAIEIDNSYKIAYNNRGLAYYKILEYDLAIKDYTRAIELDPMYADAYLNRGLIWYYKQDYNKAIEDYNKAIEINEKDSMAYHNRGLAYYKTFQYDMAIEDYTKAILLNPDYADAYLNRGLAWYYKTDYDRAIEDYNKALEIRENYKIAYNNRGLAWHYKGEYNKAISDYDKVLAIDSKYIDAYINRGISYYYKGQYNEAIHDYEEALKINDKLEYLYNNIGLAYFNKGYYKEALQNYNKALKLYPNYADALNNRGMVWYEKGEYDKSIQDCTKAIELHPNYADAFNNRGNAWYFKQEWEKAESDYKKVSEYQGYEAIGNSNLGDVLAAKGEFQKAQEAYKLAGQFHDLPEWLNKQISEQKIRNSKSLHFAKINVPNQFIQKRTAIEDRLERTLTNIRKIAKSDAKSVVHYTKLFVSEIYVTSLNSKMHYSNAIYMNDPMEGKVFFEYLDDKRIDEAYLNGEKRNESSVYLGSFLPAEDSRFGKSHEDELVMWRTYGKDANGKEAAGCNLVLSSEFFKEIKKPVANEPSISEYKEIEQEVASIKEDYTKNKAGDEELLNVIYIDLHNNERSLKNDVTGNLEPALKELKGLLNELIELRDKSKNHKEFCDYIDNTIFKHLSTISFLFKSADYIFENEVRVIEYVPRDSDRIKFMPVSQPNLPKKRFYIESNNEILPFIKKIHFGPKVENHQQWGLYFDFELRQRAKELAAMTNPFYELNPSEILISKSECKFQ